MTDQQILELTAKAAGITLDANETAEAAGRFAVLQDGGKWDPLRDDADCFRLLAALGFEIRRYRHDPCHVFIGHPEVGSVVFENIEKNPSEALRLAIVRMAVQVHFFREGRLRPHNID